MGFTQAVKSCFRQYVGFRGRAPRSEYWYFVLFYIIGVVVLSVIDTLLFGMESGMAPLSSLFTLGTLLPSLAASIRRLHDIDRTGWWVLLWFVPIVGMIVLIVFFVQRGTAGTNRFGPDPLA